MYYGYRQTRYDEEEDLVASGPKLPDVKATWTISSHPLQIVISGSVDLLGTFQAT